MISTRARLFFGTLLLLQAGCGLLDTEQPNIIDPGSLDNPAGAQARRIGAIADFTFVNDGDGSQGQDGLILLSGLMSDEFLFSTTPPSEQEFDQRGVTLNNPNLSTVYLNLHRARVSSENAAIALETFSSDSADPGIPEMQSLAGFTYLYFAETFCSGVPFSRVGGADSLVFGDPETATQTLNRAIERFDSALAQPGVAVDSSIAFLAAVGKGRALIDLGQFAAAATAVAGVPTDFQYVDEHAASPLRLQNAIWAYTNNSLWSVADSEGAVGLPFRSDSDPRVPFFDTEGPGLNGATPQFNLLKYPDATASVIVADGIEARLIEAEAQLQAGGTAAMRTTLNDLRANAIAPALPPLPAPANPVAAADMLFSERAFWLYATGHRLGDMRRLLRPPYSRSPDTVFPNGTYFQGPRPAGTYGADVNFPVPVSEQNNPQFSSCIDRNP
jgi:hypothetical protein